MAPFPEDEVITIKRLEYALKHSDYRLLREGAYKLHEKYHSHHHFEYIDLLQIILGEVEENQEIPSDIKDMLTSTIYDILNSEEKETQSRVSGLTSLSYEVNASHQEIAKENSAIQNTIKEDPEQSEEVREESYIKPFQEFTPIQPIEMVQNYNKDADTENIVNNFSEQPAEDFITETPIVEQQNIFEENKDDEEIPQYFSDESEQDETIESETEEIEEVQESNFIKIEEDDTEVPKEDEEDNQELEIREYKEDVQEEHEEDNQEVEKYDEEIVEKNEDDSTNYVEKEEASEEEDEAEEDLDEAVEEPEIEVEDETVCEQKSIAIFYSQNSSNEKISNILKYRELLYNKKDFSLSEIIYLMNEIKTQTNTNIPELQIFLDRLKSSDHKVNLITNSQSANLIDLLVQSDITYSIFDSDSDKMINLLPLLGLSNLYKCIECDEEHLDTNEEINSFILQCPKCKAAMLPELYTLKGEINMDYYNSSITALANSDTWLLIHPPLSEKLTFNMIKSAIEVSSKLREVYILDKDINTKETYKRIFEKLRPDVKVNSNINAMEEFLNNI